MLDAYLRVSLAGIELLTVDARIVIASVDTYLRFAQTVNRLHIVESDSARGLPQLAATVGEGAAKSKTKKAIDHARRALGFGDQ